MINNNPNKRPTVEEVYNDLMNIEFPLKNIGDKLSDFQVINGKIMYQKLTFHQ